MKKTLIFLIIGLFLISVGLLWWGNGVAAVNTHNTTQQTFIVPPGAGIKRIASDLKAQKLIKDPTVFYLLVKQMGIEKKIQAGSYRLSQSQSAEQIAKALIVGTEDVWVTIPEGKRAEEIAEILQKTMPGYQNSWVDELKLHEGYLFPDTYLFPKDATIETIITTLLGTFDDKYSTIQPSTTLTKAQIVTLASMIEREAITDEEKPIISGIIQNRMNAGMPLQIDATIQYVKGKTGAWWEPVLLTEYKSVTSNYNTYLQPGLPPGPIANPGLASLKAAADPADTDYVYYLHDKNRQIRYAKTLEQHEANIQKYGL